MAIDAATEGMATAVATGHVVNQVTLRGEF